MKCRRSKKKILRKRTDKIIGKGDGISSMYLSKDMDEERISKHKKWKKQGFRVKLFNNNLVRGYKHEVIYWYRWNGNE